ncbi:hypothetical protein BDR26DRAFT_899495 [Obelidium mucronatum]|nr:hypothetical protein BDR26DRAFT_899495 [Obelidium mucronatum]
MTTLTSSTTTTPLVKETVLDKEDTVLEINESPQSTQTKNQDRVLPAPKATLETYKNVVTFTTSLFVVLGILGSLAVGNLFMEGYQRTTRVSRTVVQGILCVLPFVQNNSICASVQAQAEDAIARVV